jgi:hypothetical protein
MIPVIYQDFQVNEIGGTCNDDGNGYTCTCGQGYSGDHCDEGRFNCVFLLSNDCTYDIPRFSSKRNVVILSTVVIIENITMLVRLRAINVWYSECREELCYTFWILNKTLEKLQFPHFKLYIYMKQHSKDTCIWSIYLSVDTIFQSLRLLSEFSLYRVVANMETTEPRVPIG